MAKCVSARERERKGKTDAGILVKHVLVVQSLGRVLQAIHQRRDIYYIRYAIITKIREDDTRKKIREERVKKKKEKNTNLISLVDSSSESR